MVVMYSVMIFFYRGKLSLETISLIMAYKIKYPENVFLLRGNHECANINRLVVHENSRVKSHQAASSNSPLCRIYGFYDECKRRYSIKLWKTFTDCFNCLPIGKLMGFLVISITLIDAQFHFSCSSG